MATRRRYIKIYYDYSLAFNSLSDAQLGRLLKAMLKYAEKGTAPDFNDDEVLVVAWAVVSGGIDWDMGR